MKNFIYAIYSSRLKYILLIVVVILVFLVILLTKQPSTPSVPPASIELTPQLTFTPQEHLDMLLGCNALAGSWSTTGELNPNAVVDYFHAIWNKEERLPRVTPSLPKHPQNGDSMMYAEYIEQVGELYFGVSSDFLRKSSYYYKPANSYSLLGLGSVASCNIKEIVEHNEQSKIIFDMLWDGEPYADGELTIQNAPDGSWKYQSLTLNEH